MNGFKHLLSLLILASSVEAMDLAPSVKPGCRIYGYRSESDTNMHFMLKKVVEATDCSYNTVVQTLRDNDISLCDDHTLFLLNDTSVMLIEFDDDEKSAWDDEYEKTWTPIQETEIPDIEGMVVLGPFNEIAPVRASNIPFVTLPDLPKTNQYDFSTTVPDYDPWVSMTVPEYPLDEKSLMEIFGDLSLYGDLPVPGEGPTSGPTEDLPQALPVKVGLPNLGAVTCYANSLLQCLVSVPSFYDRLYEACLNLQLTNETLGGSMFVILRNMKAGIVPSNQELLDFLSSVYADLKGTINICDESVNFIQSDSAEVLAAIFEFLTVNLIPPEQRPFITLDGGAIDDIFGLLVTDTRVSHTGNVQKHSRSEYMLTLNASSEVLAQLDSMQDQLEIVNALAMFAAQGADVGYYEAAQQIDNVLMRANLEEMIMSSLFPDETVSEGQVMETITKSFNKLPPFLFINYSRSGYGYRIGNPIDFPMKYTICTLYLKLNPF